MSLYADKYFDRSKYSFDVTDYFDLHTIVEYDEYPVVKEGVEFKIRLKFHQLINDKSVQGYVNVSLTEGWTVCIRTALFTAESLFSSFASNNIFSLLWLLSRIPLPSILILSASIA